MDQLLEELTSDKMDSILKEALIAQKTLTSDEINKLVSNRDNSIDKAKKSIQSTCYAIDYTKKVLKVFDTYTNKIQHEIPLAGNPQNYSPEDFEAWGSAISIIDFTEFQKEADINFNKNHLYGLAVYKDKSYIYSSDIDNQNYLPISDKFIFGANSKNKNSSLPYDMYFSKNKEILCLSNRDEGKVYVFSTKENKFIADISVRSAGSSKAINVAIADSTKKIYLTSSQTPVIYCYDLATATLNKKALTQLGILGNICLSPDEKTLFTIITKPEANFKALNADTFEEVKSFQPKGEFFSSADDPCDLLELAPDKKHIFYMTYINDPKPFTPVLTVIDIEKGKSIKRFSIKDDVKPISISFKESNPVGIANKSFDSLLVENGYFTFNKLREFKLSLLKGNQVLVEKTKVQPVVENPDTKDKKLSKTLHEKKTTLSKSIVTDNTETSLPTKEKIEIPTTSNDPDNNNSASDIKEPKVFTPPTILSGNTKHINVTMKSLRVDLQDAVKKIQNSLNKDELEKFAKPTAEKINSVLGQGNEALTDQEKSLIETKTSKWEASEDINMANAAVVLSWTKTFEKDNSKGAKK